MQIRGVAYNVRNLKTRPLDCVWIEHARADARFIGDIPAVALSDSPWLSDATINAVIGFDPDVFYEPEITGFCPDIGWTTMQPHVQYGTGPQALIHPTHPFWAHFANPPLAEHNAAGALWLVALCLAYQNQLDAGNGDRGGWVSLADVAVDLSEQQLLWVVRNYRHTLQIAASVLRDGSEFKLQQFTSIRDTTLLLRDPERCAVSRFGHLVLSRDVNKIFYIHQNDDNSFNETLRFDTCPPQGQRYAKINPADVVATFHIHVELLRRRTVGLWPRTGALKSSLSLIGII